MNQLHVHNGVFIPDLSREEKTDLHAAWSDL